MMRPLAGLRVVEVSCGLAASFAATLLADFGADVVVVEGPPGAGHPLRQITPFYLPALSPGGQPQNASFFQAVEGRNKRFLCLELEGKEGQEILWRLIRQADLPPVSCGVVYPRENREYERYHQIWEIKEELFGKSLGWLDRMGTPAGTPTGGADLKRISAF